MSTAWGDEIAVYVKPDTQAFIDFYLGDSDFTDNQVDATRQGLFVNVLAPVSVTTVTQTSTVPVTTTLTQTSSVPVTTTQTQMSSVTVAVPTTVTQSVLGSQRSFTVYAMAGGWGKELTLNTTSLP
ncbi:hypothetical protein HDU86_001504 [Geranomyces michiganensis]|nr:hypothetical protein HDU86_001504 [Geranomyces michiganensis]